MLRKLFAAFVIFSALPTVPAAQAQAAAPAAATSSQFKASTVSTGDAHTCALDDTASVWCWGSNTNGQLGDGSKTARLVPTRIPSLAGVTRVQAGAKFSCALKSDGTVWCWGFNSFGQLGNGTKLDKLTPTRVPSLSGIQHLAGGASPLAPMCALKTDGSAWCWGANTLGQLGDGTKTIRLAPVKVKFPASITAIAPGATSCLISSGTPFCWGQNNLGQIGDGSKTARLVPTAVSRLGEITRIATSPTTTCAIDADARTWCWGGNAQGRVGDGTTTDRLTPVRVLDLDAANRIATGDATCAVTPAGALRCWGSNTAGAVGDGTKLNRRAPVTPTGALSAVEVATAAHSCAASSSGDVWCWGQGAAGQLGNAQKLTSLTPQLASPTATPATTTTTTTTTIPRTTTTTTPGATTTTIPRATTTTTTTIPRTTTTTTPATTTTVPAPAAPAAPQLSMRAPLVQGSVSNALVSFPLTPGAVAYRTECRAGAQRLPAAGTTSPILVPQLTAAASYACTLSVNVRGVWSAPSELSNTAVAYRTPAPPTNAAATVIASSPGDVSVAFTPGAENGAAVSSYRATCSSTAGSTSRRFATSPTSPVVVVGIPPGRAYVCTVAAQNQAGWSPESISSTAFATYAPAAAPANLTAAAADRGVALSWDPVASTSAAPVSGYRVYRADALVCQVLAPATSCTATGLANGTEYAFQVLAYHLSTEGALSAPATATPFGRPDAPVIDAVALEPSATSATLDVSVASSQGSPLTDWQLACSSTSGAFSVDAAASGLSARLDATALVIDTEYSCTARAKNQAGWSEPSAPASFTPYTTPSAPENLTIALADAAFSLSWDAPSGNGRPVTSYTVEWSSNGTDWSAPVETTSTSHTVTGLTNGTPHTVRVRAKNLAGLSTPTEATDTPAALPTAPTSLEATPRDGGLELVWVQTDLISAGVTSWRVLLDDQLACTSTREACSITGLQNGTTYSVTIVAVGRTGSSPASTSLDATPYGAPDAPSLVVSLRDPSGHDVSHVAGIVTPTALNGAPMLRAELLCTALDALAAESTFSVVEDGRTLVITDPRPGLSYTCRARVENLGGWSPWSATSEPLVPYRTPDAPTVSVSLMNETPTSVSVVVPDPAFDGGRSIAAYSATCTSDTGQTRSATATSSPVAVHDLTPGAAYVCRSRVENLAGWSPFSEDSDRVYPRTTPDAPTGVEVVSNPDGTITVRWAAPAFDGGAPIARYTVTIPSSGRTCETTDLACTFDGLELGSEYVFVISATNIAGSSPTTPPASGTPSAAPPAPETPTASVVPASPTSAEVFFSPVSAPLPVTAYSVVCSSSNGGTTRGAAGTDSPLTVALLTPGSTYSCTVAAQNDAGWSPNSPPSDPFVAYQRPATITGLRGTAGNASVSLEWDALTSTSAAPVAGYRVFHSDGSLACLVPDATIATCTITGLQNGTSYTFQVAAFYEQSEGGLSDPITLAPNGLPTAPQITAASASTAAVTLTFQTGSANGSAFTGHTATCTSSNGGTTRSASGSASPLTVSSLTNGASYVCSVTSTNAVGTSPASNAATFSSLISSYDCPSGGSHIGGGTCQQTQHNYGWTCPSGGSLSGSTCVNGYTASDSYGAALSCWNASLDSTTSANWNSGYSYPRTANIGGYNACGGHNGYNYHRTQYSSGGTPGCWTSSSGAIAFSTSNMVGCRSDRFVNVRLYRGGGHSYSCPSGGSLSGSVCYRSWWQDTSYAATWAHVSTTYPTYAGTPVWQYSASV